MIAIAELIQPRRARPVLSGARREYCRREYCRRVKPDAPKDDPGKASL